MKKNCMISQTLCKCQTEFENFMKSQDQIFRVPEVNMKHEDCYGTHKSLLKKITKIPQGALLTTQHLKILRTFCEFLWKICEGTRSFMTVELLIEFCLKEKDSPRTWFLDFAEWYTSQKFEYHMVRCDRLIWNKGFCQRCTRFFEVVTKQQSTKEMFLLKILNGI